MLLFGMSGSLHMTSVWQYMSVVFVVTVQWPIDTTMTSLFNLSLQHEFENNKFCKLPKFAKYLENMMTGNEKC